MNILVTGGAGYIGSTAAHILIEEGHHVIIFDNLSRGNVRLIHPGSDFVKGDLLSPSDLEFVFGKNSIDAVMHFAAFAEVGESVSDPQKYYMNNVIGSINLFQAMLQNNVSKIIFSSTCATFGEPKKIPIDEEHQQCPSNPYGASKLMIERILDDYDRAFGLKFVCLRYFNAAGSYVRGNIGEMHCPESHLIPNVFKAVLDEKECLRINGSDYPTKDGTCVRDYVHVEDLIRAHTMSLDFLCREHRSEKFNIGSGEGFSVKQIIENVETIIKKPVPFEFGPRRPGDPSTLIASSEKIRTVLGWESTKNLETIVRDAWAWELEMSKLRS